MFCDDWSNSKKCSKLLNNTIIQVTYLSSGFNMFYPPGLDGLRINFAEIRTIPQNGFIYRSKNELTGKQEIKKDKLVLVVWQSDLLSRGSTVVWGHCCAFVRFSTVLVWDCKRTNIYFEIKSKMPQTTKVLSGLYAIHPQLFHTILVWPGSTNVTDSYFIDILNYPFCHSQSNRPCTI